MPTSPPRPIIAAILAVGLTALALGSPFAPASTEPSLVRAQAVASPSPSPSPAASPTPRPPALTVPANSIAVQLLGINDFHGGLEPRPVSGRPAGGAALLTAYLNRAEAEARAANGAESIRVGAGDMINASPPISALLQDEPTINVLRRMNVKFSSVGNHEFDEGIAELLRLQNGGPNPRTGNFRGAFKGDQRFQYLAANVVDGSGQPVLPPTGIVTTQGIPIGFIGIVLKETPTIVTPTGVAGLRFLDEVETVNRYVAELKGQGVETIVVLIHQGGQGAVDGSRPITGPIVQIAEGIDDEVDVIVSGHTHQGYMGTIDGKLVTQQFANGSAYSDIDLVIDRTTRDVTQKRAEIVTTFGDPQSGITPDPKMTNLVTRAAARVAPIVNRVIATAATTLTRTQNAAGESQLGNLIADSQRASAGTQIGFINPGGIREDIAAGEVTFGELFTVQPFGNDVVRLDLTGAQLERVLEQQFIQPDGRPRILGVSGLTYTYASSGSDRINPADVLVGGQPLDLNATYSVAVNNFVADGGDNFTAFTEGRNRVVGVVDVDALITFVQGLPQPFTAAIESRIQTR